MRAMRPMGLAALAAAALLAGAACHEHPNYPKLWSAELDAAKARWQTGGVTNYTISLTRTCFCSNDQIRPVRIVVRNGAFSSIVYADSAGGAADTTLFRPYLTVDRYFALVQQVIDSDPSAMVITYSPTIGFPLYFSVDPSSQLLDDEFTVETTNFVRDSL